MRKKINRVWQTTDIRHKIELFTWMVLLIILVAGLMDISMIRFSVMDFHEILEDDSKTSALVEALEQEMAAFETYMKSPDAAKREDLGQKIEKTKSAVYQLPFDYKKLGERRYARTWSIRNSFEVYERERERVLDLKEEHPEYLQSLYDVYDMQAYLLDYARSLMSESVTSGNAVYNQKYPRMIQLLAAMIALFVALFAGVWKITKMMNKAVTDPVLKLADASRRIAANDFYIEDVEVENKDELGELVAAFNKMKYATARYIETQEEKTAALDRLHEKEVERLEMENRLEMTKMELLQSQINPHFLFNTLNVIAGMANLEEADITEKMIKALSDLFRYNLRNDQAAVLVARELKMIEDYMYLQHMRFGARISYKIRCEAQAQECLIPTFTFQPLMENAILHGLTPKVTGGRILLKIRMKEKMLCITVADNGVGMSGERLAEVRSRLARKNVEGSGIGVCNIYQRMRTMYPQGSMEIFSKEQKGTVVRLMIPQE